MRLRILAPVVALAIAPLTVHAQGFAAPTQIGSTNLFVLAREIPAQTGTSSPGCEAGGVTAMRDASGVYMLRSHLVFLGRRTAAESTVAFIELSVGPWLETAKAPSDIKFSKPARVAFFDGATNADEITGEVGAEEPNGLNVAFRAGPSTARIVASALRERVLSLQFRMTPTGPDKIASITLDPDRYAAFAACMAQAKFPGA